MHWAKIHPSSSLSPGCVVWLVSFAPSTRKSEAGACSSYFRLMIWGAVRLQTCWSSQGALLATKRRREKALKVLTFWQSAQPIETLSFIYIRCLASSPDSRTVAVKSVWEVSPLSARDEWQKSWVLQCLFQMTLFSLSSSLLFFTENPFFLQAESFTIPTRSRQLKHQLQEKFLWNAIKEILPQQREREKGGSGSSVEWWMEISTALPFSPSLCHTVIPPYLSWQECNRAAVWEHSQSLHGSRRRENVTGSLSFMHEKTHIALLSQSWKYDSHKDTHKVGILLNFTC